jgi:DNA-binding CsgD family transcriptional regulator/tetratricopeptide (TPR) repeat protein
VVVRVSSPQFVGRREELAALDAAVARAIEGNGSAVLVVAEAGIGKSRLISEFAARTQATGATLVVGECVPIGEGVLPYAPIVSALRALVRERSSSDIDALVGPGHGELAPLLPELAKSADTVSDGVPSEGSQARLFERLLTVLTNASRAAPVVLVVEDIHWADQSTRDFLALLVRTAPRERIVLIASYRSEELGRNRPLRAFLHELEASGRAIRLEVPPFTRGELSEQVEAILGHPPARVLVDRLLERSEGNPFFTEELLASSARGKDLLPESLRDALLLRVEGLPAPARQVVRIAAVAGRSLDHALLAAIAGLADEELTRAIRDAVASHILATQPESGGYSFRHALVREAVYDDLLPAERRTLHVELAHVLTEGPELAGAGASAAAELAYHWHAAGQLPEALVASIRAGMAAEEVHALSEALVQYERALAIWDTATRIAIDVPLTRTEVMRRAAEAANLSGAMERAIELAASALERLDEDRDPLAAALVHERLGRYLWTAGHTGALPEYRRAVELVPAEPPSEERAFVLAADAQALMLSGRTSESAARCEEALAIARQLDAEAVQAHVLNTICGNLLTHDPDGAVAAAAQARAIARRLGLVEETARSYINASEALDAAGRIEESIALAREGVDAARELGADRHHGDFLRAEIVGRLFRSSRWSEAETLVRELVEREPTGVAGETTHTYLAQLCAERGEFDAASRALERAAAAVGHPERSEGVGRFTEVRATIELWCRRPEAALKAIAECLGAVRQEDWLFYTARVCELGARAHADIAARIPSDKALRARAAAAVDALLEAVDSQIDRMSGMSPPVVTASRATLAAERSRIDDLPDADTWEEAVKLWDAVGNHYLAAYARWREAEALLTRKGDRRSVESLVTDARAVAQELDARPLLEELDALARRARIDVRLSDESADTPSAALQKFELTPREIEVLALLADGLTNREIAGRLFISDKTASVHVSHILSKLSVPNRAAAAATAHRVGLPGARA